MTALGIFLQRKSWQSRFDEERLQQGRKLVRELQLETIEVEELDAENVTVRGSVGRKQQSTVELNFWWQQCGWDFDASCDQHQSHPCEHAAALLGWLAENDHFERACRGDATAAKRLGSLERASELLEAEEEIPTLMTSPRFSLEIIREPLTSRMSQLMKQAYGQYPSDEWVVARAMAHYGGHALPVHGQQRRQSETVVARDGTRWLVRRDYAAESVAMSQLRDVGLQALDASPMVRFLQAREQALTKRTETDSLVYSWLPPIAPALAAPYWHQFREYHCAWLQQRGWDIVMAANMGYEVHDAPPEQWTHQLIEEPGPRGWFALSVGFAVAGKHYDLLPILASLLQDRFLEETLDRPENGHVLVTLPDQSALRLPIGRVRAIMHHLAALIDPRFPQQLRLHALDVAGLAQVPELEIVPPPDLRKLSAKISHFNGFSDVEPPANLQATLRAYQLEGFRWMHFLAEHGLHGILADDMGLGKTLQTIALLLHEVVSGRSAGRPHLVIAPTSVIANWHAEIQKFAPSLRVLVLSGLERSRYFSVMTHANVVLTSYALLGRDIERLTAQEFHWVVLDEAQYIKNARSQVAQAACRLRGAQRLCLSGTPLENHLGELWSFMRFLIPGFLGSEKTFTAQYRTPIEKQGDAARLASLKQRVAPLLLRRTKDQVAKELPPKTILVHSIELRPEQKDLYETIRASMDQRVRAAIAARGMQQSQIVFLDALLKLRQICCDPRLLKDSDAAGVTGSAKLDYLCELLRSLIEEGRRILLFSQFTSMLSLIEAHLQEQGIGYLKLTGASKQRGEMVAAFQQGKIPLFLISLKAGGTGLNLTAADTVIHYDPWWNPAAEAQATDRAYRIGQTKPVFVHKLLCENTVEQRIHALQQEKARLAEELLSENEAVEKWSEATLAHLLAPMAD